MVIRRLMELSGGMNSSSATRRSGKGIYDFIERHRERIKAEADIPDETPECVALARRCQVPETHGASTSPRWPCGSSTRPNGSTTWETERDWLEFAAILHDIGYLINERSHHKHTHYLITNR